MKKRGARVLDRVELVVKVVQWVVQWSHAERVVCIMKKGHSLQASPVLKYFIKPRLVK